MSLNYVSNIEILTYLKNLDVLYKPPKNHPYKNVYRIIELRNQLKKFNENKNYLDIYIELYNCLFQFDSDIREFDNDYPIANPIYNILLSDDDFHYFVH